jgi:hypothetical protein
MLLDYFLALAKAQTHAGRWFGREKRVKNPLYILQRNTYTCVRYFNNDIASQNFSLNFNSASRLTLFNDGITGI